jgi:cation:H+ antiporter
MFNLLAVMALPGLIQPSHLEPVVLFRDYIVMLALTILLFIMAFGFKGPGRVTRIEGGILLAIFTAYMTWLGVSSLS